MNPRIFCIATGMLLLFAATSQSLYAESFLEDATLLVAPGEDPASGLLALPGMAVVTIQAKRDYLVNVTFVATDPSTLTSFKDHTSPCSQGSAWATWRWNVAPQRTNSDVSAITKGFVVNCTASKGGMSQPPEFKGRIVNIDLDADTDNTSDPLLGQKKPKTGTASDSQDQTEWPEGTDAAKNPGLVLIVNHGFEEGKYGDGSNPVEDWQQDGIKPDDLDLSQSKLKITGGRRGKLKLTYDATKLKVYRVTGSSSAELWQPNQDIPLDPGEYDLLLEGLAIGVAPIVADFYPDQGMGKPAEDKIKVTVVDLKWQVDRNRDKKAGGTASDLTDAKHPYRFWTNNDREGIKDGVGVDINPDTKDYDRSGTPDERDLEDFAPSLLISAGADEPLKAGRWSLATQWKPGSANELSMALWSSLDVNGGTAHLESAGSLAGMQSKMLGFGKMQNADRVVLPLVALQALNSGYGRSLLIEFDQIGSSFNSTTSLKPSSGIAMVMLTKGSGSTAPILAVNRHLDLVISDFRRWHEHVTAGSSNSDLFQPAATSFIDAIDGIPRYAEAEAGTWIQFDSGMADGVKSTRDKVIVFIHGYRLPPWERQTFAETALKRLYWQQFGGRMLLVSWPTEYVATDFGQAFNPRNYDRSEWVARTVGAKFLPAVITSLNGRFNTNSTNITVLCHSMGNIVLAEAVRAMNGASVANTYIALQSADVAAAYRFSAAPLTKSDLIDSVVLANLQRIQPEATLADAIAPDLYRYDAPRSQRAEIVRPRVPASPDLTLRVDGLPLQRAIARAFKKRITAYNEIDVATAGAWYTNMYYRATGAGDIGYIYNQLAIAQTTPPLFKDNWVVFANANSRPPTVPTTLISGINQPIPWATGTPDERAAILAFMTPARSRAVGADPTMAQASSGLAGSEEGIFTKAINCQSGYQYTEGPYYHSGEFNYTIGRNFVFWAEILNEIKAP